MRIKLLKLALAVTLSSAALTANAAPTYTFSILESVGGSGKEGGAWSINNSGDIVGWSNGATGSYKATYWSSTTPSAPTLLQSLGGSVNSVANQINNSGQIVGDSGNSITNGSRTGVVWSSSSNSPSQLQSGSIGWGNNNSGQIVGSSGTERMNGEYAWNSGTPGFWNQANATKTSLSSSGESQAWGINDLGTVVGYSVVSGATKATLWDSNNPNTSTILSSPYASEAWRINNSGQIIGTSNNASGVQIATLWNSPNSSTLLQSIGGADKYGYALGINNLGIVVGESLNNNNQVRATLWDGTSVIDLNSYLDLSNNSDGWVLTSASSINDNGSIVGWASNSLLNISSKAFLLQSVAAVPEADTSAMLLMGAGVMGFMARRRKQVAA